MVALQAVPAEFERAAEDFRRLLDTERIEGKPRFDLELIFEEIVTNAIRHGFTDRAPGRITVRLTRDDQVATVVFEDDGIKFDPLEGPDHTRPGSLDDAVPGGLGIVLVRSIASRLEYEYTAKLTNVLTIVVTLAPD